MYPYIDWQQNSDAEEALHATLFAATLQEFPSHGLKALEFIRQKNLIAEVMLDAVLPIRFELLDPRKSLGVVVDILTLNACLEAHQAQGLFPEMFAEYHPDFHGLLQMHFGVYPHTFHGQELPDALSMDYLVPAWVSICTKTPVEDLDKPLAGLGSLLDGSLDAGTF